MTGEFIVPPPPDTAGGDPSEVQRIIEDNFATRIPGWEAQDGTPERALIEGVAGPISQNWLKAQETLQEASRWLASSVFQLAQHEAVAASGVSTWTFNDADGHTLEAGTQITLAGLDGSRVGFEVVNDVTVAAAGTATGAGEVELIATEPGTIGNDLQADAQLESFLSFVDTITVTAPTAGGVDAESDQDYLDRFVRTAQRFTPRLVLPEHFVLFAEDWEDPTYGSPVERAVVYDGYDPGTATFLNQGMLTMCAIDATGADISSGARTALKAALEAEAISGFTVNMVTANRTTIDVEFTFSYYDGFDPDEVLTRAEAAVADYLDPARWGISPFGRSTEWINSAVVDRGSVEAVILGVEGVKRVQDMLLNADINDVSLNPIAGLPTVGTITGGYF